MGRLLLRRRGGSYRRVGVVGWASLPEVARRAATSGPPMAAWADLPRTLRAGDGSVRQEQVGWSVSRWTLVDVVALRPLLADPDGRLHVRGPWRARLRRTTLLRAKVKAERWRPSGAGAGTAVPGRVTDSPLAVLPPAVAELVSGGEFHAMIHPAADGTATEEIVALRRDGSQVTALRATRTGAGGLDADLSGAEWETVLLRATAGTPSLPGPGRGRALRA
ncbi:MAG: hypothetical protein ACRD0J_08675 [Acidimicrobiales bacterium]